MERLISHFQINIRPETLRFKQPAGTSRGIYRERKLWYVELRGNDGNRPLCGIGECAPLMQLSCDDMSRYDDVLKKACEALTATGEIPRQMLTNFPSILMGLETALLSYEACKATGDPFRLFDTPFSRGEDSLVINGLVWMGNFKEMLQRMEEKLAAGFRCVKLKIGAIDFEQELDLLRKLRQNHSNRHLEIRVDANGAFAVREAMERLQRLAEFDLHSIEQPIRQGQWESMAELCRTSPIPIALDEELIGVNTTQERVDLLDTIRPQYIILKPTLHGGFSGADEWISLAEERRIGHWATSALESNVGLNAIAQWCSRRYASLPSLPQGLGTGQLFETNHRSVSLHPEGDCLWAGDRERRDFEGKVKAFISDWHSEASTMKVKTSGSTGMPKTIVVEKKNMAAGAEKTLKYLRLKEGDTALLCLPIDYIAGKMMVVRALLGKLRLLLATPDTHPLRGLICPPMFLAVTPMQALVSLRTDGERELFHATPRIIIGGGSVSRELIEAVGACRGEVYSTYGMTETLSHIALRRLNGASPEEYYTPLTGVRVALDSNGCLTVEAPDVCPKRLVTNDLAELLPDGRFRILGRKDNVICSGGLKFQVEELEAKLSSLPCRFLLTAVPDTVLGDALTMLHEPTAADLPSICRSLLGRYEVPRKYFSVDRLPFTETGKPARLQARQLAMRLAEMDHEQPNEMSKDTTAGDL